MPPRPRTSRLELLGPLTTHFHRRSGKTSHYHEFLFFDDGDLAVAGYEDPKVSRPLLVNGETIFDDTFRAFRVQRRGETFTTIAIYALGGRFLGYYSDTTMPWTGVRRAPGGGFETDIDDLYLDHYIMPDGRGFILDLGELGEGIRQHRISPAEATLAMETAAWIDECHARGSYPAEALRGLRLDPSLLHDLPDSQV